jgi:hypothetical protein
LQLFNTTSGERTPHDWKVIFLPRKWQGRHVKKGGMALEDLLRLPSGKLT